MNGGCSPVHWWGLNCEERVIKHMGAETSWVRFCLKGVVGSSNAMGES